MGTWGHDSFENDAVLEWLEELEESQGLSLVIHTIETALENASSGLDSYESSNAIAAAEIVAALGGKPSTSLPEEIERWMGDGHHALSDSEQRIELRNKAWRVVDAVLSDSELEAIWRQSTKYEAWKSVLKDLKGRLRSMS